MHMKPNSLKRGEERWVSRPPVVVIGSSNTDLIIQAKRIPRPGETVLGGKFLSTAGGKGANQAVAAARAGGAVTFVARVGRDVFGEKALVGFAADGLNTRYVVRDPAKPSGTAVILVGCGGENCIAVAPGANSGLSPADVHNAEAAIRQARILLLQLETPLKSVRAAIGLAHSAGVPVILNPAPAQPLSSGLLRHVTILTPNETEAESLTGVRVINETTAARAAEQLRARGVQTVIIKVMVIITLGARGVMVVGESVSCLVSGYKVKAVDATGAGDVFNGALAVALAENKSLLDAARFACAAAAISVTRLGAQTSAPRRKEIEKMLAKGSVSGGGSRQKFNGHLPGRLTLAGRANRSVKKARKAPVGLRERIVAGGKLRQSVE
jgi:ribokinase